jgi:DnaJ-class molecular chaperone
MRRPITDMPKKPIQHPEWFIPECNYCGGDGVVVWAQGESCPACSGSGRDIRIAMTLLEDLLRRVK